MTRELPSDSGIVMFVVWPEFGHIVTPLAAAKALQREGYRVIFAGAGVLGAAFARWGIAFVDLGVPASSPRAPTLFGALFERRDFTRAVSEFCAVFEASLRELKPVLVLVDSLYSGFGIVAEALGVRWAQYETDLPREYAPNVPPPHLLACPQKHPESARIGLEWARSLEHVRRIREEARQRSDIPYGWGCGHFPSLLIDELERHYGRRVEFNYDTTYAPVARHPRAVFCPRQFDFGRPDGADIAWVGPCIDHERVEPDFDGSSVPSGLALAYCALGTQSARNPEAGNVLRSVIEAFEKRGGYFLVVACSEQQEHGLDRVPSTVRIVRHAPQLKLLARAQLAITHAGFNSVKECAASGTPQLAIPLSHDQPRNAALVQYHGIGVALAGDRRTASAIAEAIAEAETPAVRSRCNALSGWFAANATQHLFPEFVRRVSR